MPTKVEWTDEVWNPTRGCRRISPGCEHCYAERQAIRMSGDGGAYEGLVKLSKSGPRWTGLGHFVPDKLVEPLHWKKPRRIFVDSMSDLFFEEFSNEQIAAVFGIMVACPRHTFQVLTKRPERAVQWFRWLEKSARECNAGRGMSEAAFCLAYAQRSTLDPLLRRNVDVNCARPWPLLNVWIGVSIEDQPRAAERLPMLLDLPAALRFVSYEPALGPVDFNATIAGDVLSECDECSGQDPTCEACSGLGRVDWIIVGGESGNGARPFDLAWARSAVRQCQEAGVPVFVKQLGARPIESRRNSIEINRRTNNAKLHLKIFEASFDGPLVLNDPKGGDMAEWPADLRIREFPK